MASIRQQGRRTEIRECRTTPRGPRQFVLASFTGVLTPEILDVAERAAQRPFDRATLVARARALGVGFARRPRNRIARELLAALRHGAPVDPRIVALLRDALEPLPASAVPEHLADATEWVGEPERERGLALRGLLRTADRIAQGRGARRARDERHFPRFRSSSDGTDAASA